MNKYKLDAENKPIGRIATQVAHILMGKNRPDFRRNIYPNVEVCVQNVNHLFISLKKLKQETHIRYTGYPGGQRIENWASINKKQGKGELLRRAIYGMLPKNKLRSKMIKNLVIE
jgi:large subunit ribosomal protein L13